MGFAFAAAMMSAGCVHMRYLVRSRAYYRAVYFVARRKVSVELVTSISQRSRYSRVHMQVSLDRGM